MIEAHTGTGFDSPFPRCYAARVSSVPRQELDALVRTAFGPATSLTAVNDLAGDASTRRYLRLELCGADTPATAIVMVLADRAVAMSSDELASLPDDLTELPYVNVHHFLERLGVAIPRLYADHSERGLLLLEDVGDTTLWSVVERADPETVFTWYDRAVAELVCLQVEGTRARDASCIAFHQQFDRTLFRWELDHFLEWGVQAHRNTPLPSADAAILNQAFDAVAAELDAEARVLNHRDFHSWNLHIHDGRIRVIDFQDALLAPIPYDLATLLGDRDTPLVVTPALETRLLDSYFGKWHAAGGTRLTRDHLQRVYDLCAFQKALKVVGRFHFLHLVKGKHGYLRYLPSTIRRVRDVGTRLEGMESLMDVLDRHLPDSEAAG